MNKIFISLLVLFMIITLSGCRKTETIKDTITQEKEIIIDYSSSTSFEKAINEKKKVKDKIIKVLIYEVEKKSDSPDEDKSIGDATSLKPVLSDFFSLHPDFHPDTFLGDSSFDTIETYGMLLNDFHFSKALIPYNPRNESSLKKVGYNEYGYPTCPNDSSLAMKYCGVTREKGRADRIKWICPKVHMVKGKYVCDCENPCSAAAKGRTTYTYENLDFRMFPGIQRDSDEWDFLYKIRTIVERAIDHLKINMCVAGRKSRNHTTTKADVFLAGIASQLTVIVAHSMNCPQYIRSLKPLIA